MIREGAGMVKTNQQGQDLHRRGAAIIVASRPEEDQAASIERLIIRFQTVGLAPVIVITGYDNEALERQLGKMGVICLNSSGWRDSSDLEDARIGLDYAWRTCPSCQKILLATPGISSVRTETIRSILESPQDLTVPVYQEEKGLPVAIRRELIQGAVQAQGSGELTGLSSLAAGPVEFLTVGDPGVLSQTGQEEGEDTPGKREDSAGLLPMRPRLKLSLARDSIFFGPGPATLLRLIDETGSVRTACVRMKLSYSKGWQILNLLEEELGVAVIDRRPGGQEGGSSKLTAAGRELLDRYEQLVSEGQAQINLIFNRLFSDFPSGES